MHYSRRLVDELRHTTRNTHVPAYTALLLPTHAPQPPDNARARGLWPNFRVQAPFAIERRQEGVYGETAKTHKARASGAYLLIGVLFRDHGLFDASIAEKITDVAEDEEDAVAAIEAKPNRGVAGSDDVRGGGHQDRTVPQHTSPRSV